MSQPKPGWDLDHALEQLRQGYTLAATATRTGFDPRHLRASARAQGIDVRDE